MLSPYGGLLPVGHAVHDVESAAWREWAAMVYPRGLRLALDPTVGRALADLPAESWRSHVDSSGAEQRCTTSAPGIPDSRILNRAATEEGIRHSAPGWAVKQGPLGSSPWPGVIIVR